ncbi:hypothetical protein C1646_663192 [Rhizophagus diaphanus]|nr:hypothetical protein C1646_663192 [Rhizophagus diaphanus] [Rhizophagus sp. MUCL 43196]
MSENNEKENSTKSTPLPLLRNFNNNSNELPPTNILLHKRTNSTLTLPPDSDFATSSILNMQTNPDLHSIEFQQNLLENRRKSISNSSAKMSVHSTNNKDDRFGSHLYDDDNDDEGSRDDNLNGEGEETISDDDDINKYNNKNINYEDSLRSPLQRKFYYFFEEPRIPFDIVAVIIFTIEYFGRFYASVNKWRFFFKPMSLIDLISIIPFYVQLISKSEITARVFQRSAYQIVMISVYLMVILLASSAIMYFIERGDFHKNDMTWYRIGKDGNLEASPFQSIVHSFWWSIVTLTTTGYGDAVPVTGPGKLVAALTMTCGILVIALPTSIIGSNFNNEWALHRRIRAQMRLQKTRESLSEFTTKTRRIRILQNQNQTMLEALAEIQERLADINPPRYYRKYKKLELKHLDALDRITELEGKLERWKKIAQNLDTFHNHKFPRKGYSDSDVGDASNISIREEDNKKIGRKWKNLPFRHFNTASNRDVTRFASVESDNNNLAKHSLLSPFKTLTKLGKTLTLPKNNKNDGTPQFTKELISSPIELRYSFTPIVDPEKPKLVGCPRSSSQTTLPSEHIDNHEGKNNKDNTDKNIDKDLTAENIENENNFTKTTQNNQDITIEKNDSNSSPNNQNTETGEIEVIVTSNNSNNENF